MGPATLTTLHSFNAGIEGAAPHAGVIQASDGRFYGTTGVGGASDAGTIFKLDAAGTLTTLHSFTVGGGYPSAGLIQARTATSTVRPAGTAARRTAARSSSWMRPGR